MTKEEMAKNRERFISLWEQHVSRQGGTELLQWLVKTDFFKAPASTRFHGAYEGALCEHELDVYDRLCERLKNDPQCECSEESKVIVAFGHDLCKVNFYKPGFRNVKEDGCWVQKPIFEIEEKFPCGDHADKSIILIQQFMKLETEEILAIRAHMGGFDTAFKGGSQFVSKIFDRSRLAVHLHLADMEASYLMGRNTPAT